MPRININEIDNTIYNMDDLSNSHIVYVPGTAITGPYDNPVILRSTYEYENTFGATAPVGSPTHDYVEGLLIAGLPVLFRRIACKNQDEMDQVEKIKKAEVILKVTKMIENGAEEPPKTEEEELERLADDIIGEETETPTDPGEENPDDPGYTVKDVDMLKITEKYGGSYGNNLSVKIEEVGNAIYFRIYYLNKNVESHKLCILNPGDEDQVKRQKMIEGIENTEFDKVDVEIVVENPLDNFDMPFTYGYAEDGQKIAVLEKLTGGQDIDDVLTKQEIGQEIIKSYEYIRDKFIYDVKFITSGGFTDEVIDNNPIAQAMTKLAETRGDCVAIPDIPQNTPKEKVTQFFINIDSTYAAAYAPWCYLKLPDRQEKWMPPSYVFLYSLGRAVSGGSPVYLAPAGVKRASVTQMIKPEYEIGGDMLEYWQGSNPQCINPIMKLRSYGYVIYGQKTLFNAENSNSRLATALQELNTRLSVNEIKRYILDTAIRITFQSNNIKTWNEFKAILEPKLDSMVSNGGITDYRVKMDATTTTAEDIEKNTIRAQVRISVARVAESFEIDFILEPQSIVFADEEEELNIN